MNELLGVGRQAVDLTFLQIAVRGVIVFATTLVTVRIADRRFLSIKSAYDAVPAFILASMLARAVNGTAAFFPTIGGGLLLALLHRSLAFLSQRSHRIGNLVKGKSVELIRDGVVDHAAAARYRVSEHDLLEDLRLRGNVAGPDDVALAVFERNGEISVVPRVASR